MAETVLQRVARGLVAVNEREPWERLSEDTRNDYLRDARTAVEIVAGFTEPQTFEGTWICPECGTRYMRDVGRCGDLTGCSRPQVVRLADQVVVHRVDGLTDAEGEVADALIEAANGFGRLPAEHPDERRDFTDAIHRCQDLLAMRIARRHYPEGWPRKDAGERLR